MKKAFTILAAMLMVHHITQAQWVELGAPAHTLGANNIIFSIVTDVSGNVYAAGEFSDTNTHTYYVAKWTGDSVWQPLGTGTNALKANGYIYSLAIDASGNVYAAGAFTDGLHQSTGNIYVAKWDGSTWTKLGANGVSTVPNTSGSAIYSIAVDATGNVYAAGVFKNAGGKYYVSKWNGTTWAELGSRSGALNANHYIHNIVVDPAGDVYATGDFTDASGAQYVAEWNGTVWTEMGTGSQALGASSPINTLTADPGGNLYVAYADSVANYYVAKWNGSSWDKVGTLHANSSINTITSDLAGNLYAAGNFTDDGGQKYVAKWDGNSWQELGTGTNAFQPNSYILTIATDTSRNVYAGGYFTDFNNQYFVAKFDPNNQGPNGVNNINSSIDEITITPNPSPSHVNILISSSAEALLTVKLYDMTGREISDLYQGPVNAGMRTINFDTESIATGSYLIKVSDGKTSIQKRFVKL